jgi:hypothetical protein
VSALPAWKRALFWPLAPLLVVFGLLCLAFPLVQLSSFGPSSPHLLDDTRAAFGAGTARGVPVATDASCSRQEYGTSGRRGFHSVEYDCDFALESPDRTPPRPAPDYANMTLAEQQEAMQREMEATLAAINAAAAPRGPLDPPDEVQRTLPTVGRGRPLPSLRRLSAVGDPPRYGLVWPDGGLGLRWAKWGSEALLFWAFGIACLVAVRVMWRRLRVR